ncbi:MAG: transketolase [Nitrospirae bacterium]|nr:transketolase [Nitrospirota bacterium]
MRKLFAKFMENVSFEKENIVFLTGDVGFMSLEGLRENLKHRFINAGVAEQNMIGVAAGLAFMGNMVWCYSIAPFVTARVYEQLRNDVDLHCMNVKVVGNGGGYGYGIMGPTHHTIDDIALMHALRNFKIYVPAFASDVEQVLKLMVNENVPSYLRLGLAQDAAFDVPVFSPMRNISRGDKITVVTAGPLIHEVIGSMDKLSGKEVVDLWCIGQLPLSFPDEFILSLRKTKKLLVLEEHISHGGIGSVISTEVLSKGFALDMFVHRYALGYPSKRYGSQMWHRKECKIDSEAIYYDIMDMIA